MQDYLLEIGVEELPSTYIKNAIKQLKNDFEKLLKENGLEFESLVTYSTPRRLTIIVKNLVDSQEDSTELVKGPSAKIAYDESGNATKALQGFMKSQGLQESDIEIKDDYVYGEKTIKARSLEEIFQESIPNLIKGMNFPKNMKWGGKDIRFARPIRWLVSIYGENPLEISLEGITSTNITRGHRFLGSSEIEITKPSEYKKLLEENYVIPDPEERRKIIKRGTERLAREMSGEIIEDNRLLDELVNIVEYPTAILGRIKEEHLELPRIVITTSMKEHLRFVPIYKDEDTLLPYFVSIVNGTDKYEDVVIKGNEKVLGARLEDARFFYNDDLEQNLTDLSDNLDGITYHEKLGSMKLRVERITQLVEKIGVQLDIAKESKEQLLRAAVISKGDLLTKMVSEFTELQGIMGEIYAKNDGECALVSTAIREQYMPRYAGAELPETTIGSILSIGDKLDAISGMFAIGTIPTGSQDPFGLRRAALGIINIIRNNNWKISIKEAIKDSLFIYVEKNNLVFDYQEVSDSIYNFILSRIRVILLEEGVRYDLVDAILETEDEDIFNIFKKSFELKKWFENEDIEKTVETFTRLNNIAVKGQNTDYNVELFNEYEENLHDKFVSVKSEIEEIGLEKNYLESLEATTKLVEPINEFLDHVLVFDENEEIKNSRLALLKTVNEFLLKIIDFSKIIV
ncbi:MAG: glycine--tRNA ligase subunit beta [Tissierellia bacterium]|nr:glycine--tRNA ligase subunit beta [Tissierellia bacterium]